MSLTGAYTFVLQKIRLVVIILIAIFLISGSIWYDRVYARPQLVWQKMLENNLRTNSVTRRIAQKNDDSEVEQIVQLFFGRKVYTHSTARLSRSLGDSSSSVRTETLGTTEADFLRYSELMLGGQGQPQSDTGEVLNIWGKQLRDESQESKTGRFLQEAILGIIPIGNLTHGQRAELLRYINEQQPYKVDFAATTKTSEKGRATYAYSVEISPEKYAAVLAKYAQIIGLGQVSGVSAEEFAGLPVVKTKIIVDITTRQLMSLTYEANGRKEEYLSFGLQKPLKEPDGAIELSELQNRLQSLR